MLKDSTAPTVKVVSSCDEKDCGYDYVIEDFTINLLFKTRCQGIEFHVEITASAHFLRPILRFLDNHNPKF